MRQIWWDLGLFSCSTVLTLEASVCKVDPSPFLGLAFSSFQCFDNVFPIKLSRSSTCYIICHQYMKCMFNTCYSIIVSLLFYFNVFDNTNIPVYFVNMIPDKMLDLFWPCITLAALCSAKKMDYLKSLPAAAFMILLTRKSCWRHTDISQAS